VVFTVKKVETLTFGEKLKKAREEAGLTRRKVAQLLNIQVKYVHGLEDGENEKLPSDVYIKGLLRKYAKLLNLEPNELIAEYEKENELTQSFKEKSHRSLPQLRARWFAITPKVLSIMLGSLVFVLIIGYLIYQLNILIGPPRLVIGEPMDNLVIDKTTITLKGQSEPGVQLTINGQQIYINEDGSFSQEINLNQGMNIIKIEATNRFGKSRSETRQILVK
jgi:transcriptional regulator with XRE-family HTH domain